MSRSGSFVFGLAVMAVVLVVASTDTGRYMLPVAMGLVLYILWFLSRRRPGVNPFGVYLLLLAMVTGFFAVVKVMELFGPIAALLITVGLSGLTIYLTLQRGEGVKRQRELMGLCPHCGYDLRASDDRCPECGADLPVEITRRRRIAEELKAKRAANQPPSPPPPPAGSQTG